MEGEVFIKPDASSRNAMSIKVNGKEIKFNPAAVQAIGLRDHVQLSIAENKLNIKTNQAGKAQLPLGAVKMKHRTLQSEGAVKAARLPDGVHTIEGDEENGFFIEIQSSWTERTNFKRAPGKPRTAKAKPVEGAAEEIARKKAEKDAKKGNS